VADSSKEEAKDSVKQCKNGLAVVLLGEFESGVLSEPLKRSMLLQVLRTSVRILRSITVASEY
jgi:hypothetical protein